MQVNVMNTESNLCSSCRILKEKARLLFAEDMVKFIMWMNGFNISFRFNQRYRNLTYDAFTHSVMISISYLDTVSFEDVRNKIAILHEMGMVTSEGFEWYSRNVVDNFVAQERNTESILKTCVQIAFTAALYFDAGIEAAPYIAVVIIADAINYDLSRGGWNVVQDAAESFECMYYAIENMPTPSTDGE